MKITWLGQAGFYLEAKSGVKIMIDPYLSDSCGEKNPKSYRRIPINEDFLKIKPDIMIFTHNHIDHFDKDTAVKFLTEESKITVLSPYSVWSEARKFGGNNNYVLMEKNTEWSQNGVVVRAVKAFHSDEYAMGVVVSEGEKNYYFSGDTLYNSEIFRDLPESIEAAFLPLNGKGNNMNYEDATRFSKAINSKKCIGVHFGMLDDLKKENFPENNIEFVDVYTPYEY